jgi:hypothetical protein
MMLCTTYKYREQNHANGIGRQAYEVRKQLHDLRIAVSLLSETRLKRHMRFYIPNYDIYRTDRHGGHKGGTAAAVKKGIPHMYVNLPPLLSVEATGLRIAIGNTETLLTAAYKSPQIVWSDIYITELSHFRNKTILAGGLNAKHPVWNSKILDPSCLKLLELFVSSKFEISSP